MITKRIIPCLDVKDGRVVKGVNFAGLQDMADPVEMAAITTRPGLMSWCFMISPPAWRAARIFTDILRRVASEILSR